MPTALREAGWAVEIHDDHFPQDAKDVDLFPEVARRGWVFVTQDARVRYRAAEMDAWREAGLRVFVLVTANLNAERTGAILTKARKRMEEVATSEPAPFICRIAKNGSMKRLEFQ